VQSICQTSGLFFPAHFATVSIQGGDLVKYYGVTCNTSGLSGTVTATFAGPVNVALVSGNGLVVGNTVTWNVSDFSQLNFFHDFWVTFLTDTIPVSNQLCLTVTVSANTGTDNNPSNNTLTQCFNVVNSFDPNVKEVYPTTVSQPGDWHTYTVHFQNTGTATAQHIQVIDTLDTNLDWSSFQLLAYSHDNLTQVLQNGVVHFNFPNINLPDSTSDELNSHGWIQYRIKTKADIQPPTTIHNTASIYFDFNTPVVTNDAVVNFCTPVQSEQTFSICSGDSIQVGSNWYHQAGTYTNAFTTSSGCDSSVVTTLNAFAIDTTLATTGATVTANGSASAYQWYNCDNGQPIANANGQTFTASQNGNYAVQLTYGNSCTTMSSCVNVTSIGVTAAASASFRLFPNPANGSVTLNHPMGMKNASVGITDLTGRTVWAQPLSDNASTPIDLHNVSAGAYWVRTSVNNKILDVQRLNVIR